MVVFSDARFMREFGFDIELTIFGTSVSTPASGGSYPRLRLGPNWCS